MADTSSFSPKSPSKKASPNVSSGWVVMVLSGLVAIVIFFVVTNQGGSKTEVLVASHDIAVGDTITSSSFHLAPVNVAQAQLTRLIGSKDEKSYDNYVAIGPIKSGDFIQKTDVAAKPQDGLRYMSISVDKTHANNGALNSGDRIDVIDESPTGSAAGAVAPPPVFEASNVQVVSVNSSGGGGIGGATAFTITVAATPEQALGIAQTLKDGKFDIVRSTGSNPLGSAAPASDTTTTTTPAAQ